MFIERPEISIILLTHNRPQGLLKAVESIYSQTFQKFELIILDNGNDASYPEIIAPYLTKKNIRYIKFDENEEYIGKRLNQGLSLANGKYITFLMDDDTYDRSSLNILHKEISKDIDFIYGKVRSVDSSSGKKVRNSYSTTDWRKGEEKRINTIHITSVILKRDLIDRIGGFHEGIRRSYELNFWNRVFKESKCKRIDKVISEISVNDLSSVTGKNRAELGTLTEDYPLVGYWSERKSVSFLADERKFIDQINFRHQPWVATVGSFDTDSNVSWAYSEGADDFSGNKFYYVDHPMLIQEDMVSWCDGMISQFPLDTDKPHYLLRPTITRKDIESVDKFPHYNQKNLTIFCPKITEDNLDFIHITMDYVADRYSAVHFFLYPNSEAEYMLREIPNVLPAIIQEDSYEYLKKRNIDLVLHIEADTNSYVDAYKAFLFSSALKAPLVSSPNIAFDDVLVAGEDFLEADTIHGFVNKIDKAKDLGVSDPIIRNVRNKTYLYFLDKVVLDKFTLFLNENHKKVTHKVKGVTALEQLDSNYSVIVHSGEHISQSFTASTDSFNAVQFYGTVLSNNPGSIRFVLKLDSEILIDKTIPNYKLKNGLNTVIFGSILCDVGQTFTFTLYGDNPVFKLDYNNVVMRAGTYFSNNIPKKACLKFRIISDAEIVAS